MIGFFSGLWGKVIAVGAIVLAILAAILKIFSAGKTSGKNEVTNDVNQATAKTQAQFDKVDAEQPSVDDALSKLRARVTDSHKVPPA